MDNLLRRAGKVKAVECCKKKAKTTQCLPADWHQGTYASDAKGCSRDQLTEKGEHTQTPSDIVEHGLRPSGAAGKRRRDDALIYDEEQSGRSKQNETQRVVAIDVETTGVTAEDAVIEVACVEVIGSRRTGNIFHCFITPYEGYPARMHPKAVEKHGLTFEGLRKRSACSFGTTITSLTEFVGDSVVIGHNVEFDLRMLRNDYLRWRRLVATESCATPVQGNNTPTVQSTISEGRIDAPASYESLPSWMCTTNCVCTMKLFEDRGAMGVGCSRCDLETCLYRVDKLCDAFPGGRGHHSALQDAEATALLYIELTRETQVRT